MLNIYLRNQILKSLYQKSTPNLLETRQMLIKKTYTSGIFYLLYHQDLYSFLQSRTQYVAGSNNLRGRGGTNTPLLIIATSVRGTYPTSGYLSARYYEEGEEKDGRERRIREAARQIESSDKAACCIEAAELLILITQLGERLRGGKAHVINLRQQHRYQTYHHTNYTNQPHHIAHSRAPFHFHQHRLSNTPASPSSIRSGITWVLIKRNASHPLRTKLETWEKGGRGGCFWHRSWPTINIIYRRLNRPAASNRRL